ncbi:MAG: alpha/beta hydrolase [Rhizobiales bacterium]|nr:alpha/beta hydrolase [Rhizobacter sp.]
MFRPQIRIPQVATTVALAALLTGCGLWRPVTVPIGAIGDPAHCAARPDTLIVMLPGSGARPEEFIREGFVAAVRERRIAADLILVDAHRGYYNDRSIVDRLRADVIVPALAQGYRRIWLAGISLGAFGALIYSEAQPQGIEGVVLLGPYLGSRAASEEIAAQGGLAQWGAPTGALDPGDIDTIVWRWLQPYAVRQKPAERPDLFLGYGVGDRFVFSHKLLAAALPADRVFATEGGHDYPPWLRSWNRMLDAMPLTRDPSCAVSR